MEDLERRLPTFQKRVVKWSPPPPIVVKEIFDALFHRTDSRFGSGVVIRDEEGNVHAAVGFIHTQVRLVFEAEVLAC